MCEKMTVFQGYRKRLSPLQMQTYDALRIGMLKHAREIIVPRCTDEVLKDIFESVLLDNPEIFYVSGLKSLKRMSSSPLTIFPDYSYSEKEAKELLLKCRKSAEKMIADAYHFDEYSKELFVHDLLLNVTYGDNHKKEAHSIIGPLLYNVGVCEAISKTAKFLFDMLDMSSMVVFGVAKTPKGQKDELHAWNFINVEGIWYHLDITFDNSLSEEVLRYDYFNLSDEEINTDHKVTKDSFFKCYTGQNGYYYRNSLVAECREDALKILSKNSVVKFSPQISETEACDILTGVFSELGMKVSVKCNIKQMVFQVHRENNKL